MWNPRSIQPKSTQLDGANKNSQKKKRSSQVPRALTNNSMQKPSFYEEHVELCVHIPVVSLHWIALQWLQSVAGDKTEQRGIWIINPETKPGPVSNPLSLYLKSVYLGDWWLFPPLGWNLSALSVLLALIKAQRGFACEKSHPHVCASECNSKCAVATNFGKSFHLFSLKSTLLDNTTLQFRHSSKAQQDLSCAISNNERPKGLFRCYQM